MSNNQLSFIMLQFVVGSALIYHTMIVL